MSSDQFMIGSVSLLRYLCNSQSDERKEHNCDMETFGDRLAKARGEAGLTQTQLAKKVGVSQTTVSDIERGRNAGSGDAARFAETLGVNALWLSEGRGAMRGADTPRAGHVRESAAPTYARILQHSPDIALVVSLMRNMSDQDKGLVVAYTQALADKGRSPRKGNSAQ